MIASSYFKGGGGDINEISLSTVTVFRQRRESIEKKFQKKSGKIGKETPFEIAHWDSKIYVF
jgi:hypothetical protein